MKNLFYLYLLANLISYSCAMEKDLETFPGNIEQLLEGNDFLSNDESFVQYLNAPLILSNNLCLLSADPIDFIGHPAFKFLCEFLNQCDECDITTEFIKRHIETVLCILKNSSLQAIEQKIEEDCDVRLADLSKIIFNTRHPVVNYLLNFIVNNSEADSITTFVKQKIKILLTTCQLSTKNHHLKYECFFNGCPAFFDCPHARLKHVWAKKHMNNDLFACKFCNFKGGAIGILKHINTHKNYYTIENFKAEILAATTSQNFCLRVFKYRENFKDPYAQIQDPNNLYKARVYLKINL